jgi:hypothetical protein
VTQQLSVSPGGVVRGGVHLHFAFQIEPEQYDTYRTRLIARGCTPSDHTWPNGHRSVYAFDPDGDQIEIMTVDWVTGVGR